MSSALNRTAARRCRLSGTCRGGALLLGAVWAAWWAASASGATLRPELKLEARYDDNIHAREHGTDDLVRVIAPGLLAASSSPSIDWRIWARRSILSYTRSGAAPTFTTDAVSVRVESRSAERSPVRLWSELRRSLDDTDPDERSVFVRGKFRSGTGTALLRLERVEAMARMGAWDYSRPDQSDATTKQLQASVLPLSSETHDWLLSYRGQELHVGGRRALTSHAALAGFRRRHSDRLGSRLEGGLAEIDHHAGSPKVRRAAYTAGLTLYTKGSRTAVAEARVERDAETAVFIEARRRVGNGLASASWRRRVDAEGGYDAEPVVAQRVTVSLADTLRRSTIVSAEGRFAWTDPYRASGSGTRIYRLGILVSNPVHRWVMGRLGYDFVRQTDPDRPDPLNFRRSRIFLSLTAAIQ